MYYSAFQGINMKLSTLFFSLVFGCGLVSGQSIAATVETDQYVVSYDESTGFGGISTLFSTSDGRYGFSWGIPSSVATGGAFSADLPNFTVTAKSGYALAGDINGSVEGLSYFLFGGGSASVTASGNLAIGSSSYTLGGSLTKVAVLTTSGYEAGYFTGFASLPVSGSFASLAFTGGELALAVDSGGVWATNKGDVGFSFVVIAVPEPETYAMMIAGLGMLLVAARRCRQA